MKKISIVLFLAIVCIFNIGCSDQQIKTSKITNTQFSQTIKDKEIQNFKNNILKQTKEEKPDSIKDINKTNTVIDPIEEEQLKSEESFEIIIEETEIKTKEEIEIIEETTSLNEQNYNEENISEQQNIIEKEEQENANTSGLTENSGINYYDGRTETYYSSDALYHQDTENWDVDDEGFYRTDEGYYVVAASDMPQGTTFEGSKGTCIVLDSGCDEGVTDYYVSWS